MKERTLKRIAARERRLAAGRRNPTDYPMPVPAGKYSANVVPVTFAEWQAAKTGVGHPVVIRLFRRCGGYQIKPHRGSVGVIWNGQAWWWTPKGFYRPGKSDGARPPLQHAVYEKATGKKVPRLHEIFFRDRNRNNFAPENLELLSKAQLHLRCIELGEVRQLTHAERSLVAGKRWMKQSRTGTATLLQQFQSGSRTMAQLATRKQTFNLGPKL